MRAGPRARPADRGAGNRRRARRFVDSKLCAQRRLVAEIRLVGYQHGSDATRGRGGEVTVDDEIVGRRTGRDHRDKVRNVRNDELCITAQVGAPERRAARQYFGDAHLLVLRIARAVHAVAAGDHEFAALRSCFVLGTRDVADPHVPTKRGDDLGFEGSGGCHEARRQRSVC